MWAGSCDFPKLALGQFHTIIWASFLPLPASTLLPSSCAQSITSQQAPKIQNGMLQATSPGQGSRGKQAKAHKRGRMRHSSARRQRLCIGPRHLAITARQYMPRQRSDNAMGIRQQRYQQLMKDAQHGCGGCSLKLEARNRGQQR